jgi:hypothetical protein
VISRILSKTEIAFLSGSKQFTKPQARCIRCRLNKKLKTLNLELSELQSNKGLLTVSNFGSGVADFCNGSQDLVAQLGRALTNHEKDIEKKSLGRALIPRPLPYQGNALPG